MAQVSVRINGRPYQIACDDGQEANLTRLADYVNKRVTQLVAAVGQVGEERLLVMASLLMADELSDIFAEVKALRAAVDGRDPADRRTPAQRPGNEEMAQKLDLLAVRLERLAESLERA
jgi:cell division protein ZapA